MRSRGRQKTIASPRCPNRLHAKSNVTANGFVTGRARGGRTVRQWVCRPLTGGRHSFTLLVSDDSPAAPRQPNPRCPRHPDARTKRDGTYGSGPTHRQRYRCFPSGEKSHAFTPLLPRGHVDPADGPCPHCEELRGVHHGDTAAARGHAFSTRLIAQGLDKLSAGDSYAQVGLWAWKSVGRDPAFPARRAPDPPTTERVWNEETQTWEDPEPKPPKAVSLGSLESRAAWRVAANWVEAFAPVVWDPIEGRLRAEALAERARLDAEIELGVTPSRPQILVLDDVPVWSKQDRARRREGGFLLLIVGEVTWEQPARRRDGQQEWEPRLHLRLVRAMPKSNQPAWRLIFDELGYAPDFVVADGGTGIGAGVTAHFDPERTIFIPSLWHVRKSILRALGMNAVSTLRPSIAEHTRHLARGDAILESADTWNDWWERLEQVAIAEGLSRDKVRNQRRNYQDDIARILPHLAANPGLRLSIGGLETKIRERVQRVLTLRTQFGNIERTNHLFDLVVAREHDAFTNLDTVVRALRADSEARLGRRGHGGYAVSLRTIDDPQPESGRYRSLRDPSLLAALAESRGLA